jgi:galactokinase
VNLDGYKIVLLDSQVKHSLASSEYNVRRAQCEEGVKSIKDKYPDVESLRDVSLSMIEECLHSNETVYNRCRYVAEENIRLREGCTDLLNGNLREFGKKELDFLVESVKDMADVPGARMMGGGFGGCTINIIKEESVDMIVNNIAGKYKRAVQKDIRAYVVQIEDGTSVIS